MKSYSHIAQKLFNEPLLITPQRHSMLCQMLETKLASGMMPTRMDVGDGKADEAEIQQCGSTAIIPVHGTLVMYPEDIAMSECGCSMEDLTAMIDTVENDSSIATVIYDFRTPGGTVTGIPEAARKIYNSQKNTIAFTASECCSGGIYLASQCERFYATGSSRVGSVGVYSMMLDATAALKADGIKINAISAGKFKLLGAYWKEMTDEERGILQAGVDKIYNQFKMAVEARRVVSDEHFGNGLVFDGEDAASIGFTDGVVEDMEEILDGMV